MRTTDQNCSLIRIYRKALSVLNKMCQSNMRTGCLRYLRKAVKANVVGAQVRADNFREHR